MKTVKSYTFKRLYFPGMISLILLPLMCIGYFAYQRQFTKWAAMDVAWFDEEIIKSWNKYLNAQIHIKEYEHFPGLAITNDKIHNRAVLRKLTQIGNDIIHRKNYGGGVMVTLTDKASYADLVNVLDIGYRFKGLSVIPYKDKVFFVLPRKYSAHKSADKAVHAFFCGTTSSVYVPDPPTFFDQLVESFQPFTSFWPSIAAFILMIFFSLKEKRFSFL